MSKIQTVWVYADAAERYADLIAGARRFGAVVNAVVPCESCAAELRACGPAAVYNLGLPKAKPLRTTRKRSLRSRRAKAICSFLMPLAAARRLPPA